METSSTGGIALDDEDQQLQSNAGMALNDS